MIVISVGFIFHWRRFAQVLAKAWLLSFTPAHDLVGNQEYKQIAIRVVSQICRIEAGQPLLFSITRKAALVITNDAGILSTHPQISANIFVQLQETIAADARCVAFAEDREAHPVEAHQAVEGG